MNRICGSGSPSLPRLREAPRTFVRLVLRKLHGYSESLDSAAFRAGG